MSRQKIVISELENHELIQEYQYFCRMLMGLFELLLDEKTCGESAEHARKNEETAFRSAKHYWDILVATRNEMVKRGMLDEAIEPDFNPPF